MHFPSPPSSGSDGAPGVDVPESASDDLAEQVGALEGALRRDGWSTVATIGARPEVVIQADTARIGLVHEVARDQTAAVVATFQDGAVVSSCAYREQVDGRFYEVVLLLNPGVERAILLPTVVDENQLATCRSAADAGTVLYSILAHPTKGRLGAVEHPSPGAFRPDSA